MIPSSKAPLNSTRMGEYHLVPLSQVIEIYQSVGIDITDEDVEPPHVINVSGKECLFSGELLEINGAVHEVVIVANGFSWQDLLDDEEEIHVHDA